MTTLKTVRDESALSAINATTIFGGARNAADTEDKQWTPALLAAYLKTGLLPVEAHGSTVYSLTATAAQITGAQFILNGTVGDVFAIFFRVNVKYNGATFAAAQNAIIKARRTSGTAADCTNGSATKPTAVSTTRTENFAEFSKPFFYTLTSTADTIQLYGSVAVIPSAGSLDVTEWDVVAIRVA